MLTQQQLAAATVEALAAELRVIGADAVAEAEGALLDGAAERGHHADRLVAGDEGEAREEFAAVDVQVRAADAAGFHFDGMSFGRRVGRGTSTTECSSGLE